VLYLVVHVHPEVGCGKLKQRIVENAAKLHRFQAGIREESSKKGKKKHVKYTHLIVEALSIKQM
jgi:hypothetical protein